MVNCKWQLHGKDLGRKLISMDCDNVNCQQQLISHDISSMSPQRHKETEQVMSSKLMGNVQNNIARYAFFCSTSASKITFKLFYFLGNCD